MSFCTFSTQAQIVNEPTLIINKDSVKNNQPIIDTSKIETIKDTTAFKDHSPKKAIYYSAAFPGLGQIYNKKYWKTPIIYGGFIGLGILINFNNKNYQLFKKDFITVSNTDSTISKSYKGPYTSTQLIVLKDFYRRNRDLSIIGVVILYAANIIDAYVDAELKAFDVSDDLSLRVKPYYTPNLFQSKDIFKSSAGLTLTLRL